MTLPPQVHTHRLRHDRTTGYVFVLDVPEPGDEFPLGRVDRAPWGGWIARTFGADPAVNTGPELDPLLVWLALHPDNVIPYE